MRRRFFGRLAPDHVMHNEQTLKAVRENAQGLAGIAGERLWIELKRIAEGRNAGSVLKTMLEQNIGQYLGKITSFFLPHPLIPIRSKVFHPMLTLVK